MLEISMILLRRRPGIRFSPVTRNRPSASPLSQRKRIILVEVEAPPGRHTADEREAMRELLNAPPKLLPRSPLRVEAKLSEYVEGDARELEPSEVLSDAEGANSDDE